jgi:hypothetical protein
MPLIGPGFSRPRVAQLHKARLRKYRDIMRGNGFISTEEVQGRFRLKPEERGAWEPATRTMSRRWQVILSTPQNRTTGGEWLGIFSHPDSLTPAVVVQATEAFTPKLGVGTFWIPLSVQTLSVNPRSATLSLIPEEARLPRARWDVGGDDLESPVTGNMKRVRVVMIKRGPKELCTLLYYGRSDCVSWDPELFQWDSSTPFMSYTAKLGRGLLKQRHVVPDVIMTK